ncbi:hypothetical protein [Parapedobacter koreensis]|uniref:Outer membrane protein beta-barrel domain-containing protein n=1 Tax=Parapedobacter koreensis TaxID=332977 RepID=A0A1H7JH03_9SPHI|nr:hypothetical protein [Parapedobacter koreensis]SEK73938.1 hypothetical protein SAMN05421740_102559 [Parapedobacter koreensis]
MMRKNCFFAIIGLLFCFQVQAQQRGTYTLLQAGGLFGVATSSDQSPMHGYQFQFAFGRNFYDNVYLGLGIGTDVYRGRTTLADGTRSTRRVNTLPIFADFRLPFAQLSPLGSFGMMANAGYAPSIGNDYFKGFLGKVGVTYAHLLVEGSDLLFSAGYGFQQFDSSFSGNTFSQHNVFLTVGLFVH